MFPHLFLPESTETIEEQILIHPRMRRELEEGRAQAGFHKNFAQNASLVAHLERVGAFKSAEENDNLNNSDKKSLDDSNVSDNDSVMKASDDVDTCPDNTSVDKVSAATSSDASIKVSGKSESSDGGKSCADLRGNVSSHSSPTVTEQVPFIEFGAGRGEYLTN